MLFYISTLHLTSKLTLREVVVVDELENVFNEKHVYVAVSLQRAMKLWSTTDELLRITMLLSLLLMNISDGGEPSASHLRST